MIDLNWQKQYIPLPKINNLYVETRDHYKNGAESEKPNVQEFFKLSKMKKILQNVIPLVVVFVCNFSYGQNNMEDAVYLKNGGIIRGIIIEQVPNESIKIQTKDRNVFVFKYEEIVKITKENLPEESTYNNSKATNYKTSGFFNLTELNYCYGFGDLKVGNNTRENKDYSLGFRTVKGYQLNEYFAFGIGFGIDKYKNRTLLPITFDARATVLKGKVSPVFTFNCGYAVELDDFKGGIVFNPQFGLKTYISRNAAYLLNVGYKFQAQDIATYGYYGTGSSTARLYYQFMTISTGIVF